MSACFSFISAYCLAASLVGPALGRRRDRRRIAVRVNAATPTTAMRTSATTGGKRTCQTISGAYNTDKTEPALRRLALQPRNNPEASRT